MAAPRKILICEDEDAIREFEVINLQRSGYEVVEKHLKTGQEALDALRGIICQELNGTDYLAVPYREDRDNQNAKMEIGYIIPKNTQPDEITQIFIQEMEKYLESAKKALP